MFKGDSADTCFGKFSLILMGRRAEGIGCADPGARHERFILLSCTNKNQPQNKQKIVAVDQLYNYNLQYWMTLTDPQILLHQHGTFAANNNQS